MRIINAVAALIILAAPAAVAAPGSSPKAAALAAGDWRGAAELGASAADIVRALQAQGKDIDLVPEEAVVTIGPDNRVDVVALRPLPPLPADLSASARTAELSGTGFTFGAKRGSIVLYPASARRLAWQGTTPRP